MRRNSGLVGKLKDSAFTSTSGKYDTFDQFNYKKGNIWPLRHTATLTSSSYTCTRTVATTVNVATEGIANGTYSWSATVTGSFGLTATSGSVVITNGSGSFTVTPSIAANATNYTTSSSNIPSATFTLSLKDADGTTVIGTSQTYTISAVTFALTAPAALTEGSSGTNGLTVTGMPTNTYFTLNVNRSGGAMSYSNVGYIYNSSGTTASSTGTASFSTTKDWYTTGAANFTGTLVYNGYTMCTVTWTVADTYPSPTLYLNGGTSGITVNEGQSFTLSFTVPNSLGIGPFQVLMDGDDGTGAGSTAYWAEGANSTALSFSANFPVDIYSDNNYSYRYYLTNPYGTAIAFSPYITVIDKTPSITNIISSAGQEGEGYSATYQINGTNLTDNTISWEVVHVSTTSADFTGSTSGSFTCNGNSNQGNFSINFNADKLVEGTEQFQIKFTFSANGQTTTLATSPSRSISDLSAVSISGINLSPTSLNEGTSGITITLSGSQLSGETISWTASGGGAGDLSAQSGTMSGTGSLFLTAAADLTTEGAETFILTFSLNGNTLYTSSAITINDTSITPPPAKDYDLATATFTQRGVGISGPGNGSQYSKAIFAGPANTESSSYSGYNFGNGSKFVVSNSSSTYFYFFDRANEDATWNASVASTPSSYPYSWPNGYDAGNFTSDGAYFVTTAQGYNAQYGYSSYNSLAIMIFTCTTPFKYSSNDPMTQGYVTLYNNTGQYVYSISIADIALSHDGSKIILSSDGSYANFWTIDLTTPFSVASGSLPTTANAKWRRGLAGEYPYSYNDYARHAYGEFEFNKDGTEVTLFAYDQNDNTLNGCRLFTYALPTAYDMSSINILSPIANFDARLPSNASSGISTSYPSTWFGKSFFFDKKNEDRLYIFAAISSGESWIWEYSITKEAASTAVVAVPVHNISTATKIAISGNGVMQYGSNAAQTWIHVNCLDKFGSPSVAGNYCEIFDGSSSYTLYTESDSVYSIYNGGNSGNAWPPGANYWTDTVYRSGWSSTSMFDSDRYRYNGNTYYITSAYQLNAALNIAGQTGQNVQNNTSNLYLNYGVQQYGSSHAVDQMQPSAFGGYPGLLISYLDNQGYMRLSYIRNQSPFSPDNANSATVLDIGTIPSTYGSLKWRFNSKGTEITFLTHNPTPNTLKTYSLATAYDISTINSTAVRTKTLSFPNSNLSTLIDFDFSMKSPYDRMVTIWHSMNTYNVYAVWYSLAQPVTPFSNAPSASETALGLTSVTYTSASAFSVTFDTTAHATKFKAFLDSFLTHAESSLGISLSCNGYYHYMALVGSSAGGYTASAASSITGGGKTVSVSQSNIVQYYSQSEGSTGYNTIYLSFYQYSGGGPSVGTIVKSANAMGYDFTNAQTATAVYNAFINSGYGIFDESVIYESATKTYPGADVKSGNPVKTSNRILWPFESNLLSGAYSGSNFQSTLSLALVDTVVGTATPIVPQSTRPWSFTVTGLSQPNPSSLDIAFSTAAQATSLVAIVQKIVTAMQQFGPSQSTTMSVQTSYGNATFTINYQTSASVYQGTHCMISNSSTSYMNNGGPPTAYIFIMYTGGSFNQQAYHAQNGTDATYPIMSNVLILGSLPDLDTYITSINTQQASQYSTQYIAKFGATTAITAGMGGTFNITNASSLTQQYVPSYYGDSQAFYFGYAASGSTSTLNTTVRYSNIVYSYMGSSGIWFNSMSDAQTAATIMSSMTTVTFTDGNGSNITLYLDGTSMSVSYQGYDPSYSGYKVAVYPQNISQQNFGTYGGSISLSGFTPTN